MSGSRAGGRNGRQVADVGQASIKAAKRVPAPRPDGPAPSPHYHGHRERLRDRFLKSGGEALADYELLELVLFRAIPRRDVKPLAKTLLATFGSFAEVIAAPRQRLAEVGGLSDAAITELKVVEAAAPIASRAAR